MMTIAAGNIVRRTEYARMNIEKVRSQFPILAEGYIHLNHAGVSPMSLPVANTIAEFLQRSMKSPDGTMWGFQAHTECHAALASLMGVPTEDLALTKNTAHGLSIVADGLKWNDGDEVIFADCEYPANTYPWLAQESRGVKCVVLKTRPDGTVPVEDYAAAITAKTRVIAVSWVQFATGYRSDLAALAELAHAHGALLVADIIQGLGALPINVTELGVDIAATGSQKWLMGVVGTGGLYINPNVLDQLRLVNMGAGSVNNVLAFEPLGFDPKPTAQRYEEGTPNIPGSLGLLAAIELLKKAGADEVETRIRNVTRYAMDGLRSRGYNVLSPDADDIRAGIVLFQHPTYPNSVVMGALKAAKVHVVDRGGKVRFAPHFYNTEADFDQVFDALP